MTLPTLAADKANHALYGAAIAALALIATIPPAYALALAVNAGFAVELWQAFINWKRGRHIHDVDINDAFATGAGGLLVVLPWLV